MSSLYRMMYAGKWREVTKLLRGRQEVLYPEQATAAVVEVDGGYVAVAITPGEVFTEWHPKLPDESKWTRID